MNKSMKILTGSGQQRNRRPGLLSVHEVRMMANLPHEHAIVEDDRVFAEEDRGEEDGR